MKKIKIKTANRSFSPSKISQMITQMASDYISMGETTEECQSYLNSACTAWNIAVLPEHQREDALHRFIEEYKRLNPSIDDKGNVLHNMRILIKKKLEMFPAVKTVIVNAHLEELEGMKYRITLASTNNPRQLNDVT